MNAKQRITATLQHQEPDRVPWTPLICGAARRIYGAGYGEWSLDGEIAAQSMIMCHDLLGHDLILTLIDLNGEASGFGQEIRYFEDDPADPNFQNPLIATPDDYLTKIQPYDPTECERTSEHIRMCDILVQEKGDTVPVVGFVYGPLGVLSIMRGPERLMADIMAHPEAVHHALGVITDVLESYVHLLAKTGIYGIWMETLFCAQVMMSKQLWMDMEGKYAARLAAAARENGLTVWAHSSAVGIYYDAHIEALAPDAISNAAIPAGCSTWAETKAKWGDKVTMVGHVAPPKYMYLGTPDEVKNECRRFIEELAPGGGYILAPGWEFPPNASLLNARAMKEAAEAHRY